MDAHTADLAGIGIVGLKDELEALDDVSGHVELGRDADLDGVRQSVLVVRVDLHLAANIELAL